MKTRPIIFQPDMVKAILDGRKSQTRRIVKPQPPDWIDEFGYTCFSPKGSISGRGIYGDEGPAEKFYKCPYGVPGDRLWVRETLAESSIGSDHPHYAGYLASLPTNPGDKYDLRFHPDAAVRKDGKLVDWWDVVKRKRDDKTPSSTLPSIFMPKWASRLTLEITNIRVEGVPEITESDCEAEGLKLLQGGIRSEFALLWDKMHKKQGFGWSVNPWVWVVEFKKDGI